MLVDST